MICLAAHGGVAFYCVTAVIVISLKDFLKDHFLKIVMNGGSSLRSADKKVIYNVKWSSPDHLSEMFDWQ